VHPVDIALGREVRFVISVEFVEAIITMSDDSDGDLPELVNSSSSDEGSDEDSFPAHAGLSRVPARDEVRVLPAVFREQGAMPAKMATHASVREQGSSDAESATALRPPERQQSAPAQPAEPVFKPGFLSAPAREPAKKRNDGAAGAVAAAAAAAGAAATGAAVAAGGPPKSARSVLEMRADRLEEVAKRPKNGPLDAKLDQVELGMRRKNAVKRPYALLTLGWCAPGVDGMLPGGGGTPRP